MPINAHWNKRTISKTLISQLRSVSEANTNPCSCERNKPLNRKNSDFNGVWSRDVEKATLGTRGFFSRVAGIFGVATSGEAARKTSGTERCFLSSLLTFELFYGITFMPIRLDVSRGPIFFHVLVYSCRPIVASVPQVVVRSQSAVLSKIWTNWSNRANDWFGAIKGMALWSRGFSRGSL